MSLEPKYNPNKIEEKWQKYWEENESFKVEKNDKKEKKFFLVEFPYPSGAGLHVGHVRSYTALDVYSRLFRAKGFNVLYPMGWDAFGLPTENYAIKNKIHPEVATQENIANFKTELKTLGLSYDWSREINTTDPNYYKWTQWIFLQLYKHDLAYKKKMPINWCPSCKIGLANEEVVDGKCERCGTPTIKKEKEQWMLKITKYADRLIDDLEQVDFLEKIKNQQINWIGRSEGAEVSFELEDNKEEKITVFTTRSDTLFGVTYLALSPEHPLVSKITTEDNKEKVSEYIKEAKHKSDLERTELQKDKTGVFTGSYAIHPLTGKKIPVWIADYILINYGTGSIMAVPAHDQRDFEFAKKYDLEIIPVVSKMKEKEELDLEEAMTEKGFSINSDFLNGLKTEEAKAEMNKHLKENNLGKKTINYNLRDWIFSRQHYWGEPIPVVYCDKCGAVPVPEDQLPITLPKVDNYEPTDTGESPLAKIDSWVNTTCPVCGEKAKRETDTMPNWAGSSWYWLRYADPDNDEAFANLDKIKYWCPVDLYNGGMEHTTLHLLYSRFWNKFLYDIKKVPYSEPYKKRVSHGMILAEDGRKMSKSFGNTISPKEIIEKQGADALRMYEMFIGPFSETIPWSDKGLIGCKKFLERVYDYFFNYIKEGEKESPENKELNILLNKTIKKVGEDIENFKFNTVVSALMILFNELKIKDSFHYFKKEDMEKILLILNPIAPHLASELWNNIEEKEDILDVFWPEYDEKIISEEKIKLIVQTNGKLRGTLEIEAGLSQEEVENLIYNSDNFSINNKKGVKKIIFIPNKLINFVV
ncbi:leucine--tRNA ligase [bacterium]|nr:leucine--tRNA ligase [bacterium]